VFFRAISSETVPNVTGHHFLTFFAQSYFLITNMHVATEEYVCYVLLLLLNWSWSCSFGLGLSLGLNILVLVLILYLWSWSWS